MTFAAANDYVVLTNDLDFAAILASSRHKKPSVAQIRAQDLSPDVIGKRIVAALRHVQKELEAGALLTIESDRTRLRMLPLKKNCDDPAPPRMARGAGFMRFLLLSFD